MSVHQAFTTALGAMAAISGQVPAEWWEPLTGDKKQAEKAAAQQPMDPGLKRILHGFTTGNTRGTPADRPTP